MVAEGEGGAVHPGRTEYRGWALDVEVDFGDRRLELRMRTTSTSVAIVGPSGAGKSTILRTLAGVERRARGSLDFDGDRWLDPERGVVVQPWERRVGWVPQEASLFPHLSVAENLGYGGAPPSAVSAMADLLEVGDLLERRPRRLSGGERQRVAVGRALLAQPRLLLLDEPFSALDRPLRDKLAGKVRQWATGADVPLVLVSHDESDSRVLADEHWHLSEGVLERSATPPDPPPA